MATDNVARGMAGSALGKAGRQANTVVLLGDSRTNQATNISADTLKNLNAQGYYTWLNVLSGAKYSLLNEAGVDGQRTDQIFARLSTDVYPYSPTICMIEAGVNDIVQGIDQDVIFTNIYNACRDLIGRSIVPVILTIPPWDASYASLPTAAGRARLDNLNSNIRRLPFMVPGTIVSDLAATLTDPTTGYAKTNVMFDGMHQTSYGAQLGGARLKADLDAYFVQRPFGPYSITDSYGYNSNSRQTLSAPLFMLSDGSGAVADGGTNGTGSSGVVGTGWTCAATAGSPTVVCSLPARSDGYGFNQRMVVTAGANGDTVVLSQIISGGRAAIGDYISGGCDIDVSSVTNLRAAYLRCDSNVAGKTSRQSSVAVPSSTASVANNISAFSGRLKTHPQQIDPTGSVINSTAFYVYLVFNGAGGATVDVGRCELRKSTNSLLV